MVAQVVSHASLTSRNRQAPPPQRRLSRAATPRARRSAQYPEAVALIAAQLLEFIRDGKSVGYGPTMKAIVEEKFGAGIMSAIDFMLDIEKVPDPGGDRVKITMNGEFLPYKKW